MTWPFVNPASGYRTLSRLDSDSRLPSISTSTRLAATRRTVLAVHLEPDRRRRPLVNAPARRELLDEMQADPAAARHVGPALSDGGPPVFGVEDLDVQPGPAALQEQAQDRADAAASMADPVRHQLGDEQQDVRDRVGGPTAGGLARAA